MHLFLSLILNYLNIGISLATSGRRLQVFIRSSMTERNLFRFFLRFLEAGESAREAGKTRRDHEIRL